LADANRKKLPTAEEKEMLLKAGLGLKKITFSESDNFLDTISGADRDENGEYVGFPQLKNCGGFELLRCQANKRVLALIDCEWTVKSLKRFVGPQGKIYVRPVQQNLSTEPITRHVATAEPTESCRVCGENIQIKSLRAHLERHNETPNTPNSPIAEPHTDSLEFVTTDQGPDDLRTEVIITTDESGSIQSIVTTAIKKLVDDDIDNPVEMLRFLQKTIVTGRALEISSPSEALEGETNFINIDRDDILVTAFTEQHCQVVFKCRHCAKTFTRNAPRKGSCHAKADNFIKFDQATGKRGEEAEEIFKTFMKNIHNLVIDTKNTKEDHDPTKRQATRPRPVFTLKRKAPAFEAAQRKRQREYTPSPRFSEESSEEEMETVWK